jgi:RNA polymerase sigma-70 factor (ECF subfamily)
MRGRAATFDDDDLARRVDAGDIRGAFDLLHRAYRDDVRRLVGLIAKGGAVVDDVCQEVWEGVLQALPGFRFECASRSWVLSIARRRAIDVHRRRTPDTSVDSQVAHPGPLGGLLGLRTVKTPSRELRSAERRRTLDDALSGFSAEERELLELRFVVGLKPAEIVKLLGLSATPNTLSQRLVRLVRKLRVELEDKDELASMAR